jgi:hypothetical protein
LVNRQRVLREGNLVQGNQGDSVILGYAKPAMVDHTWENQTILNLKLDQRRSPAMTISGLSIAVRRKWQQLSG